MGDVIVYLFNSLLFVCVCVLTYLFGLVFVWLYIGKCVYVWLWICVFVRGICVLMGRSTEVEGGGGLLMFYRNWCVCMCVCMCVGHGEMG